ncbi:MAG: DUF2059 domain-containing protein [Pseudorhodobacter sp.]|nr:MAG: DUF2059 domain-containing protein [Pseudorhodobacter sp.]
MARWFFALLLSVFAVALPAGQACAEGQLSQQVRSLAQTLLIPEAMEVLRDEGIANGQTLAGEAADAQGGAEPTFWTKALDRIYAPPRMLDLFSRAFDAALAEDGATIDAATTFFATAAGQRALRLEISARRALMDDDVEAAAALAYERLAQENPARHALIDRFVEANDLIDSNVMGAMNANLAFLRGMAASGVQGFDLSEADMLAQVWGTEGDTRVETVEWVYPFLTMAYQPLSDADLLAYVEFSESEAGKRLNAAMFAGFDVMLNAVSHELGLAYGQSMQGDDI